LKTGNLAGSGGGSGVEKLMLEAKTQDAAIRGREFVLQELIKTENDYVRDLSYVVEGYLAIIDSASPPIPKPETFSDTKKRLLFANIESIYKFHKE
jgi:triple functional domain protein